MFYQCKNKAAKSHFHFLLTVAAPVDNSHSVTLTPVIKILTGLMRAFVLESSDKPFFIFYSRLLQDAY